MKILKGTIRGIKWVTKLSPWYFPVMILNSLFSNLSPFINIYFSARIIDEISGDKNVETLITLVLATLIINAFMSLASTLLSRMEKVTQTIYNQGGLKAHLTNKFFGSDFEQLEHGAIMMDHWNIYQASRLNGFGIVAMCNSCKMFLDNSFNIVFSVLGLTSIFVIVFNHMNVVSGTPFIWILLLLLCLYILLSFKNAKTLAKLGEETAAIGRKQNIISDYFNEVSAYQAGKDHRLYKMEHVINEYRQKKLNSTKSKNRKYYYGSRNTQIPEVLLSNAFNFTISSFVCLNALSGLFGIGSVVMYVGIIQRFISAVKNVASNFALLKTNASFLEKNLDFYQNKTTIYNGTQLISKHKEETFTIEFRNVSFKYPKSDQYVLRNLNLTISNRKKLAIVGMNGSGKTTMIKLLCRFYDPTEGVVLLNNIDIRHYDYEEYIRLFSVVFQDFSLFHFTLGQNVAVSNLYDVKKVQQCLIKSGFGERLDRLPKGLNTHLYKGISEDGVEISGGEAQKIALARALYKDAPFMVLDEPTAALDPIAEFDIYHRFNSIVGDKTAIYISHRLSSCRFCDDIVVFHEGVLVQHGSHDQLVADKDGKYYELWNAQAQYYIPSDDTVPGQP